MRIENIYNERFFKEFIIKEYSCDKESENALTKPIKCRFCGKVNPDVHFRNKAHSISEALGNRFLFTFDECNECNDNFASKEKHLVDYVNPALSLSKIQGKNKTKKLPTADGSFIRFFDESDLSLEIQKAKQAGFKVEIATSNDHLPYRENSINTVPVQRQKHL